MNHYSFRLLLITLGILGLDRQPTCQEKYELKVEGTEKRKGAALDSAIHHLSPCLSFQSDLWWQPHSGFMLHFGPMLQNTLNSIKTSTGHK